MSIGEQNESVLPEYAVDNLGTAFKVILVNSATCRKADGRNEIFIPDYQGLIKKIALTRAAHPMKLKSGDIKFLRKTLGLRSKELAEKLDVSPEHLSRCETGDKVLSSNSEKVLRSLVLLEAIYVVKKVIEDSKKDHPDVSDKISKLIDDLSGIMTGLKISPIHDANDLLVFHFRRVSENDSGQKPANDHQSTSGSEWLDEAA